MAKVYCACIECKHNKNNICKAKEIKISSWNIATVHHGRKRMEECLTYDKSEEYMELERYLKKVGVIPNGR